MAANHSDTLAADEAALAALGVDLSEVRTVAPLSGGLSGARLSRLTLEQRMPSGARWRRSRILKRVTAGASWLDAPEDDLALPEVQLWTSGLLADLPRCIETGVLAYAAMDAPGDLARGALLLADERAYLHHPAFHSPPGRLPPFVFRVLACLARLHACYWDDPRLTEASFLMSARQALLLVAPARIAARIATGDPTPYLRCAAQGWGDFFRLAPPSDGETLRAVFDDPDPYVAAIERLPRTLVHGDVWGPNLGTLPPTHEAPRGGHRLLLLDWALAAAAPCTYDPLWLCGTWHALDPVRVLAAYRAQLERRLAARGQSLSPVIWRALVDAGYLRTTLTCGEALARTAMNAPAGAARARAEARIRWWAQRGARAARRLMEDGAGGG